MCVKANRCPNPRSEELRERLCGVSSARAKRRGAMSVSERFLAGEQGGIHPEIDRPEMCTEHSLGKEAEFLEPLHRSLPPHTGAALHFVGRLCEMDVYSVAQLFRDSEARPHRRWSVRISRMRH